MKELKTVSTTLPSINNSPFVGLMITERNDEL